MLITTELPSVDVRQLLHVVCSSDELSCDSAQLTYVILVWVWLVSLMCICEYYDEVRSVCTTCSYSIFYYYYSKLLFCSPSQTDLLRVNRTYCCVGFVSVSVLLVTIPYNDLSVLI